MTISQIQQIVGTKVDGIMGPDTEKAIKAYQKQLGVTADGIWGSKTQTAYEKSLSKSTSTPKTGVFGPNGEYIYNLDADGNPTGNPMPNPDYVAPKTTASDSTTKNTNTTSTTQYETISPKHKEEAPINIPFIYLGSTYIQDSSGKWKSYKEPTSTQSENTTPTTPTTPTKVPDDSNNKYNTTTEELNPNYIDAASNVEDYSKSGDTKTSYYNATERNQAAEQQNLGYESGFSKIAGNSNLVSKSFLNKLSSDPSIMAFYVNALTYGGYTMGDILNDMKRRELISKGGTNATALKNLVVINPEQNRNTYLSTDDGQKAVSDISTMIPTFNFQGLLNPDILKYGSNMPDDLFKVLVPILDPESQEFKDAVEEVKATYFDLTSAQLQATTEQDKAVADYNLQQFKDQLQTNYGIALSDDATKAWTQIETLTDTYASNNLAGSGLQNEAIDKTLQATRKADQRLRDEKLTKEEQNKAAYYRSSATDEEINKLTPEQKKAWGLVPSDEVASQFSIANLKAKNPAWTDEMVKQAHDSVIDKYGNYRSAIYAKYYSGIASTGQQQQTTAVNAVTTDVLNKEAQAYKDYTTSTAFLGQTATGTNPASTTTPTGSNPVQDTTTGSTAELTAAQKAAADIKTGLTGATTTTPTPTPNNTINPVSSTPTKKVYSTVYDYYMGTTGANQAWNSAQRTKDAAAAKIANYTGTSTQNDALLKYLNSL